MLLLYQVLKMERKHKTPVCAYGVGAKIANNKLSAAHIRVAVLQQYS